MKIFAGRKVWEYLDLISTVVSTVMKKSILITGSEISKGGV